MLGKIMTILNLTLGDVMTMSSHAYENVFYCTYQNKVCVDSSNPIVVDKTKITELLELVGAVETNFIGFIDPDGTTLQFYVDGIDNIWVEIPVIAEKGSYGKQISEAEMQSIVSDLIYPYLSYKKILNLEFIAW